MRITKKRFNWTLSLQGLRQQGHCQIRQVPRARWLAQLAAGDTISKGQRLQFRRNQVRAVQRVLFGVDKLFSRAGSAAIWTPRGLERYWRDLRTAGTHVCDMADVVYCAWANHAFDTEGPVNVMH